MQFKIDMLDDYARNLLEFEYFDHALKIHFNNLNYKIQWFHGKKNPFVADSYHNIGIVF